jgi:hypothetical protein
MQDTDSRPSKLSQTRHTLRDLRDCRFVGPREYCNLLISGEHLERCDEQLLGIRGVCDLKTGVRFLIEEEELFRARDTR